MEEHKEGISQQSILRNQRSDEFVSTYANNVFFEPSMWDLKIVFGEIDQSFGVIQQHTAVTVPWSLAKLALYYMSTQVVAYEIANGKIPVVQSLLPPVPPPPPEDQKDDPVFQAVFEAMKKLQSDFIKTA